MKAQPKKMNLRNRGILSAPMERWECRILWMKLCVRTRVVCKREKDSKCHTRIGDAFLFEAKEPYLHGVSPSSISIFWFCAMAWTGFVFVLCTGRTSSYLHYAHILICNHELSSPLSFSLFMKTFIKACVQKENIISPLHYPRWGEH